VVVCTAPGTETAQEVAKTMAVMSSCAHHPRLSNRET
jgi:hypothetical protein